MGILFDKLFTEVYGRRNLYGNSVNHMLVCFRLQAEVREETFEILGGFVNQRESLIDKWLFH